MGNKKGAQTKTESTTTASPEAMAAYREILSRATTAADKPYEAYTGERVAEFSPDQMAAFAATRDAQGIATPFLTEATGMARAGAAPIDAAAIARYQNPYQQNVIDATIADLQTQNAIAQTQVTGNAALRGALGGSRVGVAQALTAGEQARSQNPLIANMRASGYDKALAAAQQDRAASSSGASLMAGLGDASSTAAYRDIASLYGMGQQQQANTQAGLDAAYQAWQQQQAYPTQQISWLSDVAGRAGAGMGSSTIGTKTDPAPNSTAAILGAVGTVAGAALGGPMGASIGGSLGSAAGGSMGGGNKTLANGGVVPAYAMGGVVGYEDGGPVSYAGGNPDSLIDLSLDNTGAYSMSGSEGLPTEMAGSEGTPSGGFNWQSLGNPLMQAGFALMANESPHLGVAIGNAGKVGMKAYGDNQKAEADKKYKEAQLQLQRDRLGASLEAQREKLASENWIPLGPSNDPERPGYYFMDKKTGKTELKDMSVAPRAGAAAGTTRAGIERQLANDLIEEARKRGEVIDLEEGVRRARTIGRERVDAEITRRDRIAQQAVVNGTYPDIRSARRAMGIPEDLPTLALPVRPTAPPVTVTPSPSGPMTLTPAAPATRGMAPAAPPVEGAGRFSPARALPLPREIPASPGPLPRAVPRPAGSTDASLKAAAQTRIEAARAAGRTEEVNAILQQLRDWGVTP